jgi:cell division protein FtsQ
MSDSVYSNITFEDLEDFNKYMNRREEKVPVKKDKKVLFLKLFVIVMVAVLLVEALLYTTIVPGLSPAKIEVFGNESISTRSVMELIADVNNQTWAKFDTAEAVQKLSYIPCIESVSVEKTFPDKVLINITERTPVAKTVLIEDGKSVSVQIDKNGVLFKQSNSTVLSDSSIPLVTGIPLESLQDGTRLSSKYRILMDRIADISVLPQNYFAAISEIKILPKDYGNYELVLYPINSRVRVLTDSLLTRETLDYMIVTLDVVKKVEYDVSEVDLRYGSVSYRKKQFLTDTIAE